MARGGSVGFRPNSSYDTTVLLMLGKDKGAAPDYFMLMNYRPGDDSIVIVPVKPNTAVGLQSVSRLYRTGGAMGVIDGIKSSFGIICKDYIKFDKDSFIEFVSVSGATTVNILHGIETNGYIFPEGQQDLGAAELYEYLTYDFYNGGENSSYGEDYQYMVQATVTASFINKNSRSLTAGKLQTLFEKILYNCDTSLDFSDFTTNQRAYLYTAENSVNIAEYYNPYGETNYADDGEELFFITESSLNSIKSRFGLDEE